MALRKDASRRRVHLAGRAARYRRFRETALPVLVVGRDADCLPALELAFSVDLFYWCLF